MAIYFLLEAIKPFASASAQITLKLDRVSVQKNSVCLETRLIKLINCWAISPTYKFLRELNKEDYTILIATCLALKT